MILSIIATISFFCGEFLALTPTPKRRVSVRVVDRTMMLAWPPVHMALQVQVQLPPPEALARTTSDTPAHTPFPRRSYAQQYRESANPKIKKLTACIVEVLSVISSADPLLKMVFQRTEDTFVTLLKFEVELTPKCGRLTSCTKMNKCTK